MKTMGSTFLERSGAIFPVSSPQPSAGFWNNSHGTLTSGALSLFPDRRKAAEVPGGTGVRDVGQMETNLGEKLR